MAFSSSVPAYNLDHHTNWHHQLQQPPPNNHHQQQLLQNPHLPPQPPQVDQGSIRPGSMVDRARIAKLPLPEAGLNCPRCDSTQTKFCYFNNYSLTQPRHFCKTCRRYWTRGGALRSVPVGGGCRRNKRSKSRTSKSPNITNNNNQKGPSSSNNISTESPSRSTDQMVANHNNPFSSQVPLMAALQNLNSHYGAAAGSTYGGFQMGNGSSGQSEMGFQLGHNNTSNVTNNILSSGGAQGTWRLPILTGFEQPSGSNLFSYQGEGIEAASAGPVKVEETRGGGGLNLSRQFLGVSDQNNTNNSNSNQYWGTGGGNSWTTDFTSHINNTSSASTPFL